MSYIRSLAKTIMIVSRHAAYEPYSIRLGTRRLTMLTFSTWGCAALSDGLQAMAHGTICLRLSPPPPSFPARTHT